MPVPGSAGTNTPLSPDELADLIPSLATKEELNEFERENILSARTWALSRTRSDLLTQDYAKELHRRMFDQTWKWAGTFRRVEKNIGVPFYEIPERLENLLRDARYWVEHQTYPPDEIAVRLHHSLTFIHPFPNGNGRHARLMADVVAVKLGKPVFTWGRAELVAVGETREAYSKALRAADDGDVGPLWRFSRS
jgi:Fic-DOC domain mobile mystery protein B